MFLGRSSGTSKICKGICEVLGEKIWKMYDCCSVMPNWNCLILLSKTLLQVSITKLYHFFPLIRSVCTVCIGVKIMDDISILTFEISSRVCLVNKYVKLFEQVSKA